jgi:hypothetical protein
MIALYCLHAALRRLLDVIESCGAVGEPQDLFAMIGANRVDNASTCET